MNEAKPYNYRYMTYVHGYHQREQARLQDQASTLVELLHADTVYPEGSRVLEAGCGVGAQTVTLAGRSPGATIISVDISERSIVEASEKIRKAGYSNVWFRQADIFQLPFDPESFDHIFVCFVLEHLASPVEALRSLGTFLKPGGTITVIEGDHGSACFYPESEAAQKVIHCQVELQKLAGGNANIGRELYPLLRASGFGHTKVTPRMVYVDAGIPELVEGFINNTFTAMIEGVRQPALDAGLSDAVTFDEGVRALYRTMEKDGVFCYTFFKAVAVKG